MDINDFSTTFDTLLNSYGGKLVTQGEETALRGTALDEYEKSVLLTQAQNDLMVNYYNGRNAAGESFESTEEMRRYFDNLIKQKKYLSADQIDGSGVSDKSVFYKLPKDVAFIVMEQVKFADKSLGCYNGSVAGVYPITHDEYNKIRRNPFRGPTKYKVLRLDSGKDPSGMFEGSEWKPGEKTVELISDYTLGEYLIRYLKRPNPIILVDLPDDLSIEGERNKSKECELNPILHGTIVEMAVQKALQTRSVR